MPAPLDALPAAPQRYEPLATMTTTIRLPLKTKQRLAAAARRRGMSLPAYLAALGQQAADALPVSPVALELERMALQGLGNTALATIRRRAAQTGAATLTDREIDVVVRRTRRSRHAAA
jgi:hypothetical protein